MICHELICADLVSLVVCAQQKLTAVISYMISVPVTATPFYVQVLYTAIDMSTEEREDEILGDLEKLRCKCNNATTRQEEDEILEREREKRAGRGTGESPVRASKRRYGRIFTMTLRRSSETLLSL
jgi:hypothetical protein